MFHVILHVNFGDVFPRLIEPCTLAETSAEGFRSVSSAIGPGRLASKTRTVSLTGLPEIDEPRAATRRPPISFTAWTILESSKRTVVRSPVQIASQGFATGRSQRPSVGTRGTASRVILVSIAPECSDRSWTDTLAEDLSRSTRNSS